LLVLAGTVAGMVCAADAPIALTGTRRAIVNMSWELGSIAVIEQLAPADHGRPRAAVP